MIFPSPFISLRFDRFILCLGLGIFLSACAPKSSVHTLDSHPVSSSYPSLIAYSNSYCQTKTAQECHDDYWYGFDQLLHAKYGDKDPSFYKECSLYPNACEDKESFEDLYRSFIQ